MKYQIALIAVLFFAAPAFSQTDCSVLKKGKFKHVDIPTAWFVINGNKHTEYLENGKYYIRSTIKWLSDCSYTTVLKKSTVPGFPFKPGDTMTVTITKTEDGIIYFSSELKGEKTEGRVRKE